ncbi:MAG TPA: hypothetical protein VF785_07390 [Gemmatimonadaceae bacterium]
MPTLPRIHFAAARVATRFALVVAASLSVAAPTVRAQNFPSKLSDADFWKLVTDFSEANGYFRSDNFVSNETTYQWVIPDLLRTTKPGGVYLGVGPDQNFTYLVALKPKIGFIFDIRRQNMLTHLMYKAIIEQSSDRADFLSRLFARPRPAGLDTATSTEALFGAYQAVARDTIVARKNLASIRDRLTKHHGFALSDEDLSTIAYVYAAFVDAGPDLTYNFSQGRMGFGRGMPSYAQLQIEADSAGVHRSYMASEANFRALKELEVNNLVVPIVGDFAGPKAIRSVSAYLKEHHATVTAFYLSNVEQYLFNQEDDWRKFFGNVGSLPLDSTSTFIRSVFNGMGFNRAGPGMRAQQMLASMLTQVRLFNEGRLSSYYDVVQTSR